MKHYIEFDLGENGANVDEFPTREKRDSAFEVLKNVLKADKRFIIGNDMVIAIDKIVMVKKVDEGVVTIPDRDKTGPRKRSPRPSVKKGGLKKGKCK